eukprot:g19892.t1
MATRKRRSGRGGQAHKPGSSRCLDSFIIALKQTCDAKPWYTSTKQLQLASLNFCTACRSVPTLCVKVEEDTPIRLWMGAPVRETRSAKRLHATRVPVVRACGVAWKLRAHRSSELAEVVDLASTWGQVQSGCGLGDVA